VNKEEWQAKQETMDIEAAERLHEKSNLLVTKKILGGALGAVVACGGSS
jgi:hypothetical protein